MGFSLAGCCSWFDKEVMAFTHSASVYDWSFKTEKNNSVFVYSVCVGVCV